MKFYYFKGRPHARPNWWATGGINLEGNRYFKVVTPWFVVGFTLREGKKK